MEIGLTNEEKGITYFDLVYELHGTRDRVFTTEAEQTFCIWFIKNFSALNMLFLKGTSSNISHFLRDYLIKNSQGKTYHQRGVDPKIFDYLNQKWFLNGEAAKQYLDYLELQESRLAAQQARKQSNWSIVIAVGAIVLSTIFGIVSMYQPENAQPPYEVKVIEDKTRNDELQKENKQLKEELFKAEMMVKVLEEKDIPPLKK